jgi:hypothetical protein
MDKQLSSKQSPGTCDDESSLSSLSDFEEDGLVNTSQESIVGNGSCKAVKLGRETSQGMIPT